MRSPGEIEQSEVDGRAVGQLRVWPGGLAMTRSIGDYEAGDPVIGVCVCVHLWGWSVVYLLMCASSELVCICQATAALVLIHFLASALADSERFKRAL